MRSNLLRKTAMTTTFYLRTEVCMHKKKIVSLNRMSHDLDASFFVKLAVIFMWKRLTK